MALIKTPGGEFYVDDTQFQVDYSNNSLILIGGSGDPSSVLAHNNNPNAHQVIELDCGDLS